MMLKISKTSVDDGGYIRVNTIYITIQYTYESETADISVETIMNSGSTSTPVESLGHVFLYDCNGNLVTE